MELKAALQKAGRILDDERTNPTSWYEATVFKLPTIQSTPREQIFNLLGEQWRESNSPTNLSTQRKNRPRCLNGDPQRYVFDGENLELLKILYSQVRASDRELFISHLLCRIRESRISKKPNNQAYSYPTFMGYISELPLLVEFSVRLGYTELLFKELETLDVWRASLLFVLMQIEDMIALNFNVFSEAILERIPKMLSRLLRNLHAASRKGKHTIKTILADEPVVALVDQSTFVGEMDGIVQAVGKNCEKALYLYLKGQLTQQANIAINLDRGKVVTFLAQLGFSKQMTDSLDAAESNYRSTSTPFELKNSLGHLRSFLEHLHREAAKVISAKLGDSCEDTWGAATLYLRIQEYLSKKEESFVTALYGLISDESIHTLIAEQEYARMFRNVVIEYGLLLLTTLDKRGIRLLDSPGAEDVSAEV